MIVKNFRMILRVHHQKLRVHYRKAKGAASEAEGVDGDPEGETMDRGDLGKCGGDFVGWTSSGRPPRGGWAGRWSNRGRGVRDFQVTGSRDMGFTDRGHG